MKPKTSICKICFKPIESNSLHSLLVEPTICHKCFNKFSPVFQKFRVDGVNALSIFNYDQTIQELLFQFKGCFDYELRTVFIEYFLSYLRFKYFGYVVIPAPSHVSHDEKRGFNHVVEIFKSLKLPILQIIKKNTEEKQSNLTAKERANIYKHLSIDNGHQIINKKVLLVDDVYTTGSTMKAMIKLVRQFNPKKIEVLVLSKTQNPT